MARRAANLTLVMLVQQIKPEYWQHSSDPTFRTLLENAHKANALPRDDPNRIHQLREAAHAIAEYVIFCLVAAGCEVEDVHAILHGDDTQRSWDHINSCSVEVGKYLHIHILIKFTNRDKSASFNCKTCQLGRGF